MLADINADLISTYETVVRFPSAIWRRVAALPTRPDFYYELRAVEPSTLGKLDRATRFVYLNRFCFNGVYRTNLYGQFNVARGKGHLFVPERETFIAFADKIRHAELRCGDFEPVVDSAGRGDFLYLDPPYSLDGKRDRGEYGIGTFRENDEERLIEAVQRAARRGARILLSYSPTPRVLKRFRDWNIKKLSVTRNVSGFASARRSAEEVLISNYDWT